MRSRETYAIRSVGTNLRGWAVGEHHPQARHPNSLVAEVRAMRAAGMTYRAIALATGVHCATVGDWCRGRRRGQAPARFIARPVREPSAVNHESAQDHRASEQGARPNDAADTVNATVKERR